MLTLVLIEGLLNIHQCVSDLICHNSPEGALALLALETEKFLDAFVHVSNGRHVLWAPTTWRRLLVVKHRLILFCAIAVAAAIEHAIL
jgi:hypothetical protein